MKNFLDIFRRPHWTWTWGNGFPNLSIAAMVSLCGWHGMVRDTAFVVYDTNVQYKLMPLSAHEITRLKWTKLYKYAAKGTHDIH